MKSKDTHSLPCSCWRRVGHKGNKNTVSKDVLQSKQNQPGANVDAAIGQLQLTHTHTHIYIL